MRDIESTGLAEISDLSLGLPALPSWTVIRDNLLHTLDEIFSRDYDAVLLDGEHGSGKTVALAQFCARHPKSSFSLFLKPASEVAYDSAYCRMDLCNQMNWHLNGTTLPNTSYPSAAEYRNLLHRLSSDARRRRSTCYFVVDGLVDIPASAAGSRELLVSLLPFGLPGLRFLVSGKLEQIPELRQRKLRVKEQTIAPFSLEETTALLADVQPDARIIKDIHKRFSTSPTKLASLRRIYSAGGYITPDIDQLEDSSSDLFELEWDLNAAPADGVDRALATVAYFPSVSDITTLAEIAGLSSLELRTALLQLPYVSVDHRDNASFCSEGLRLVAKRKLAKLESDILERCISILGGRPIDTRTAQVMPELLERRGRPEELLHFLSRDNIAAILGATNSLASVIQKLNRGQDVARTAADTDRELQFALDKSCVKQLLSSDFSEAQLRATLKLVGPDKATQLAQSQIAVEDRLHALSLVAKYQRRTASVDPSLVAEIANLCRLVDVKGIGERAVAIASEIMYFDPALAFELLKNSADTDDEANSLDVALTTISLRAFLRSNDSQSTVSALRDMIAVDAAEHSDNIASLIGLFAEGQSATATMAEAAKVTKTADKLAILQQWVRRNHRQPEAIRVSLQIIQSVLDDSTYGPNASIFRDATLPLAIAETPNSAAIDVIAVAKSQDPVIKTAGPLVDYFRTRLHVARFLTISVADCRSLTAFEEDAMALEDEQSIVVRVAGLAWLHACVTSIPRCDEYSDDLGVRIYGRTELRSAVDTLLKQSAEHFEVLRPVIRALAGVDDDLMCELIAKVNTLARRDRCYEWAARCVRSNPLWAPSLGAERSSASKYIAAISSARLRDAVRVRHVQWLAQAVKANMGKLDAADIECMAALSDPIERVRACGTLIEVASLQSDEVMLGNLLRYLAEAVDAAETPARQRLACYLAADLLPANQLATALGYFERAGGARFNADHEDALVSVATEALRFYAGLVRMRVASSADWQKCERIIGAIASPLLRCELSSKLALLIYKADATRARDIASKLVRDMILEFQRSGQLLQPVIAGLMVVVAPSLWIVHPAQAIQLLKSLDDGAREAAYDNILSYMLDGVILGEPNRRGKVPQHSVSDETASDAMVVLGVVEADGTVYVHVTRLLRSLRDKAHRGNINRAQTQEMRAQLRNLARSKLPAKRGVQHEGYLILVDAEVLAFERTTDAAWKPILDRIGHVSNTADIAYIQATLLGTIPKRNTRVRADVFEACVDLIPKLPLFEDRVDRANSLFEEGYDVSPERCRRLVREVFESSLVTDRAALRRRRLRLIETVYRVDEDLAASLTSLAEKNEMISIGRLEMSDKLSTIKLAKELATNRCGAEIISSKLEELVGGCYQALARLNGGASTSISISELRQLVLRAGESGFTDAAVIHAYIGEAIYRRYQNRREGPEYLREFFHRFIETFDLLNQLLTRLRRRGDNDRNPPPRRDRTGELTVLPGAREGALLWVSNWVALNAQETLLIVDPYFGPRDVQAIEMVQRQCPACNIKVVTTDKGQQKTSNQSIKGIYDSCWREMSVGEPPETTIIVVKSEGDVTAELHDRWWLGDKVGITMGTSFNSLGDKLSELRSLDETSCVALKAEMATYTGLQRRTRSGLRLSYEMFTLY